MLSGSPVCTSYHLSPFSCLMSHFTSHPTLSLSCRTRSSVSGYITLANILSTFFTSSSTIVRRPSTSAYLPVIPHSVLCVENHFTQCTLETELSIFMHPLRVNPQSCFTLTSPPTVLHLAYQILFLLVVSQDVPLWSLPILLSPLITLSHFIYSQMVHSLFYRISPPISI